MPNTSPTVTLDIRRWATNGDGWTNVMGSNNAMYSYKYIGGNHPTGHSGAIQHTVGAGQATVTLNSQADACYQFIEVSFIGDNANQLSSTGNDAHRRVITNKCTHEIDAHYKVKVIDTGVPDGKGGHVTLLCDPAISNVKT